MTHVPEPALPDREGGLRRLRLDLGYDGAGFSGWAVQPGLRTVQGAVQQALARALRLDAEPSVTCAGRTDAGVHARGQVAHVDVPEAALGTTAGLGPDPLADGTLLRRLGSALPPDVRVVRVALAPDGFDARFSALWRRYSYRLADDPTGPAPLRRGFVVARRRPLDVDAMDRAGAGLLGEHDFAAYCRPRAGASTVRTLLSLHCRREDPAAGEGAGEVAVEVTADAFCHSMVRAIVGALVAVGEGRRPAEWPADVLAAGVRDSAVTVAPAQGLVLEEVRYPADADLAARQRETRAHRGHRAHTGAGRPPLTATE
ncbi:MAG: tRNA pseudouridine(38-40) synthase TruA [Candidatus Nanopelagicales bacterium]